jgi:hypothetical protein
MPQPKGLGVECLDPEGFKVPSEIVKDDDDLKVSFTPKKPGNHLVLIIDDGKPVCKPVIFLINFEDDKLSCDVQPVDVTPNPSQEKVLETSPLLQSEDLEALEVLPLKETPKIAGRDVNLVFAPSPSRGLNVTCLDPDGKKVATEVEKDGDDLKVCLLPKANGNHLVVILDEDKVLYKPAMLAVKITGKKKSCDLQPEDVLPTPSQEKALEAATSFKLDDLKELEELPVKDSPKVTGKTVNLVCAVPQPTGLSVECFDPQGKKSCV